jgi:DNA-binding transcriptional LysR family regulator
MALTFCDRLSCGQFGAAARELHLSQQAVSARVRGMEALVGSTLHLRMLGFEQ